MKAWLLRLLGFHSRAEIVAMVRANQDIAFVASERAVWDLSTVCWPSYDDRRVFSKDHARVLAAMVRRHFEIE